MVGWHRVVEDDDPPCELGLALLELELVGHHDRLGLDPLRPERPAQPEHRKASAAWRDELERLFASDPLRHLHGLGANVLVPVCLESGQRPLNRLIELGRAREPMANVVAQLDEAPIGARSGNPLGEDPIHRSLQRGEGQLGL